MPSDWSRQGFGELPSALKRFVRRDFSDFQFSDSRGELHGFTKRISTDLNLILIFEKIHHWGLGKAFSMLVGYEHKPIDATPSMRLYPFFRFFDRERLE